MGNSQSVRPGISLAAGGAGRLAHGRSLATYRGNRERKKTGATVGRPLAVRVWESDEHIRVQGHR
jgi:hypothetical protein